MAPRPGRYIGGLLGLLALASSPRAVEAQQWSVTPYLGYYQPTGDLFAGSVTFPDFPGTTGTFTGKNQGGIGFGGLLGFTQPSGLGFEFGAGYYQSDVEFDVCATDGGVTECVEGDESGSVVPLVARVSYRFSPATAKTQFYGAAGATYLLRSGDAWEGDEVEKNTFGGTLALGVLFPITPTLKLRVEVGDFLYSSKPFDAGDLEAVFLDEFGVDADASVDSKFKNDFSLNLGLVIPFGTN